MNNDRINIEDIALHTPPPGCPTPCPILDSTDLQDVTDLPYSLSVEEPDGRRWVVTAEEKEKIERAARLGSSLLSSARAGCQRALTDLRVRMHVTRWETTR